MNSLLFRFDDVCGNANMQDHFDFTDLLFRKLNCEIWWAVSPLTAKSEKETQRVFPQKWNALSDYRQHYKLDSVHLPGIHPKVKVASHGLIHIDHRLLTYEAQEMSILISCSLTGAKMFVPPFNKWNHNTQAICEENDIALIKFEKNWLSMEFNKFEPGHHAWYLHARAWTRESLETWLMEGM